MTGRTKLAALFLTAAISASAATAAGIDAKLWDGSWHLDAAASKFSAAGKEQSETRTYSYSGGKLTMKSTSKDADGKQIDFTYSARLDGKWYPMKGNPRADSIAVTAAGPREVKANSRLHGKLTVKSVATVSADGKHLTLKRTYVGTKGSPTETLEFGR